MSENTKKKDKKEILAAKLKENLRRRKAQAKVRKLSKNPAGKLNTQE